MKRHPPFLALAAGLTLCGAAAAQDADRPWYVGASQAFTYESNVLNRSAAALSDTVSTTSLFGGLNARLGRQRAYADLLLDHQRYQELSARDTNGYRAGLGLDWETIGRLSGNVALNSQRRQSDFNVGGIQQVSDSNVERSDDLALRARLGADSLLSFDASAGHRRVKFSAPEFAYRQYQQDNASAGLTYRPSGILSLSVGVSGAETRYSAPAPGDVTADRNQRRDLYLGANWVPTGASTINARLSFGKQEYDRAAIQDFEGVTGYVTWGWKPTGHLALQTTLTRDSGQDSGFLRVVETGTGFVASATDFARITNRIGVSADYELTGKIGVKAALSHARRSLLDSVSGARGRDNTTELSIGARWAVTRTVALGCSAGRTSRSASGAGSSDFDNATVSCFGSVTID